MELKLIDIVKGNRVNFNYYRAGYLYYNVTVQEQTYTFPVPVSDCGDATFLAEDKSEIMMRYIRKAREDGSFVKVIQ